LVGPSVLVNFFAWNRQPATFRVLSIHNYSVLLLLGVCRRVSLMLVFSFVTFAGAAIFYYSIIDIFKINLFALLRKITKMPITLY